MKFGLLLFAGLLIVYAKLLWPVIFGRMRAEGVSFVVAVLDVSLHLVEYFAHAASWFITGLPVSQRIAQVNEVRADARPVRFSNAWRLCVFARDMPV